jgi:hypothetical protein
MKQIYDPFEFVYEVELFTIAMLASFITWKFLNAMYENIYEPSIDVIIDSNKTENYYIKIGNHYIQIGMIIKEFIKWVVLLIVLMIAYNLLING